MSSRQFEWKGEGYCKRCNILLNKLYSSILCAECSLKNPYRGEESAHEEAVKECFYDLGTNLTRTRRWTKKKPQCP